MSKLLLVSGDLMLGARVEGAARQCGLTMVTAAGHAPAIAASADECRVVLIDLRTPGLDVAELVDALRQQTAHLSIIACAPHVHEQRLDEARRAGCDLVVTRGQLDREAEAIFQRIVDEI
ncbi:MAG: response regulator [Planctomycetes bacterium]|nr:response regulator [Planctomycetota bacterium]